MNAPTKEIVETESNLATAVCAVMSEVKRLEKADKNEFAKYMFTSVDDFKDAIRPLMAKHGLSVHVDEKSFKIQELDTADKTGKVKKSNIAKYKYAMTLYHKSGENSKPERATVALPFVGAQTSGIAKSYAIKEWFKSRFLASAGDQQEEADLMDNTNEGRLTKAESRRLEEALRAEMNGIVELRDHVKLRDWWQENYYRIQTLPKDWEVGLKTDWITQGRTLKAQDDLDKATDDELDERAVNQDNPLRG